MQYNVCIRSWRTPCPTSSALSGARPGPGRSSSRRPKQNNKQQETQIIIIITIVIIIVLVTLLIQHIINTYNQTNQTHKLTTRTMTQHKVRAGAPRGDARRAAGRAPAHVGGQGFPGYGFHLSTNHFEIIREVFGLRRLVFLFLRLEAPLS